MPIAEQPSRQTLDGIPGRVLTFLIAVGKYLAIRAALATKGYTEAEHEFAWGLLKKLAIVPAAAAPTLDKAVRDAIVELDAWDEPNFEVIRAVLDRLGPQLSDFVFNSLGPKQGPEAVISVSTLLDRLDALESGPDRSSTRTADQAALETLAIRGYTKEERLRLRGLVATAQTVVMTKPISDEEREKTLLQLYGWHNEWTTIARMVLTRRDHRIQVGIAKRRKSKSEAAPAPAAPASAQEPAIPLVKPDVP